MWTRPRLRHVLLALIALLLTVGEVSAGTPTASAFSRAGLPVEYLDVYSAAMGRNVRVEYQSGTAPAPVPNPAWIPPSSG